MSFRRTLMIVLAVGVVFHFLANSSCASLLNGDFSDGLNGWTGEHLYVPDPINDPFNGIWIPDSPGVVTEDDHVVIRTLGETENIAPISLNQWFEIPDWAYTLSFDISFSWGAEGSSDQESGLLGFPDFFVTSWLDFNDPAFDRSFFGIDPIGPFDPDTFSDITLIALGDDWFRFTTNIEDIQGHYGILYFDLFDDLNDKYSLVKLDNVHINPIPEPSTFLLLGIGLAGLSGILRRNNEN